MNGFLPRKMRRSPGGIAAAASLIPWLFGGAGVVFGLMMWIGAPAPAPDVETAADSSELQSVRVALQTSQGENKMLRHELDRLLTGRRREGAGASGAAPQSAAPLPAVSPPADDPQLRELTKRLQHTLLRVRTGDREAMQSAAIDMMGVVRRGQKGFPALLDLYMEVTDPEARKLLLAPMLFIGGTEARDFVMSQAEAETDPGLKKLLLDQAAKYATPDVAGKLEGTFVDRLQSDDDSGARLTAVRGLRYAQGAEAEKALLNAARDRDEKVRLAAMDVLASRPKMLKQLGEIAAGDPSPRVRQVAECRLMVAENLP